MWWGNVGRSPQKVQVVFRVICGARNATASPPASNRRPEIACPKAEDLNTLCSFRKLMMGSTRPRISCYNQQYIEE